MALEYNLWKDAFGDVLPVNIRLFIRKHRAGSQQAVNLGFITSGCIHRLKLDSNKLFQPPVGAKTRKDPINKITSSFNPIGQAKFLSPALAKDNHGSSVTGRAGGGSAQPHAGAKRVSGNVEENHVIFRVHPVRAADNRPGIGGFERASAGDQPALKLLDARSAQERAGAVGPQSLNLGRLVVRSEAEQLYDAKRHRMG